MVEFNKNNICFVDTKKYKELINNAKKEKKSRLCLHHDEKSLLHESIIVSTREDKSQFIHKHIHTSETSLVLEGILLIILFDEEGEITNSYILKKNMILRIEKNMYHIALPLSEYVIFFEIKNGPHTVNANIEPAWMPNRFNENYQYLDKISEYIKEILGDTGNDIV